VGIIGRNGAGKSTLLKILSRITEPTEGYAEVHGRVGSLLEVGTGFHPELTGGENIYLNGAILGMKRAEIEAKFDEIVAFAEVEKFIDSPVKHYSTGMYLRLAFAVAAHLEPEILLVDEVLAVGDTQFQKKCLGKMQDVAEQGRTVLFVSHNMAAVRALCQQGLVLKEGRLGFLGTVQSAIQNYNAAASEAQQPRQGAEVEFGNVSVGNAGNSTIQPSEPFEARSELHLRSGLPGFRMFCIIQDADREILVHARADHHDLPSLTKPGDFLVRVVFPPLWLSPGVYAMHFKVLANCLGHDQARYLSDTVMIDVSPGSRCQAMLGRLTPDTLWETESTSDLGRNRDTPSSVR
jgi:lipopolysaccharide transport system ATP-binding protein